MQHLSDGLPTIASQRAAQSPAPAATDALRIGLVNLMPNKETTERQFALLLAEGARPVDLQLFHMAGHQSRNTDADYLDRFYAPLTAKAVDRLDGIIVTGAPVEHLAFEAVDYWRDLVQVFDRIRARRLPALHICWAAQAALYRHHGVDKVALPRKAFGVERLRVCTPEQPIAAGLGPEFPVPVSRHAAIRYRDVEALPGIAVVAASPLSGLVLATEPAVNAVYMSNHLEYDADTLACEYRRDRAAGHDIALPFGYFPGDDPARPPVAIWRPSARRFFANWTRQVATVADAADQRVVA